MNLKKMVKIWSLGPKNAPNVKDNASHGRTVPCGNLKLGTLQDPKISKLAPQGPEGSSERLKWSKEAPNVRNLPKRT